MNSDITIIFYTSNHISDYFMGNILDNLKKATEGIPIISVSHKPMDLGTNICVGNMNRSPYSIYKQILIGAKEAKTKYVATAEDDVLYTPWSFEHRPKDDVASYDVNKWSIFTWSKPALFSHRQRRTMTNMICTRDLMVKTLEERYEKYPEEVDIPYHRWCEPGRYEKHIKVSPVKNETYMSNMPSVVFSTPEALGYGNLGHRKRHSRIRATAIPYWGEAESILKLYAPNS